MTAPALAARLAAFETATLHKLGAGAILSSQIRMRANR